MNVKAYLPGLLGLAVLLLAPSMGWGQYNPPNTPLGRPTVSPYLNLLSTDQFGISNYQRLVRPMIEERDNAQQQQASLQQLQQQFNQTQHDLQRQPQYGVRTGHLTRFMNYTHYYNMQSRYTR